MYCIGNVKELEGGAIVGTLKSLVIESPIKFELQVKLQKFNADYLVFAEKIHIGYGYNRYGTKTRRRLVLFQLMSPEFGANPINGILLPDREAKFYNEFNMVWFPKD